jgi:HAD superfamily hydrolase (TIGR01509 family)
MIRALIFDFDGLILDTESAIYQSWQELYQANGCTLSIDLWLSCVGTSEWYFDPLEELERQLGRPVDRRAVDPLRRQREAELIAALETLPGVEAYLSSARRLGLKTGVASSASCAWITGHLGRLGLLDYFDCLLGGDDVARTKPSPDLFLAMLTALEVEAGEALVFEDSLNGVLAARQAGICCVAVPNAVTRRLSLDGADFHLDSLADLSLEALLALARQVNGRSP